MRHAFARRRDQSRAQAAVIEHASNRRRQLGWCRVDEQPVALVLDDLDGARRPRRDNRRPAGHRLDDDIAKTFVGRCQHEDVRARDELPRVGLKSPEADARGHAETGGQPLERAAIGTVTENPGLASASCASVSSNNG